MSLSAQKRDGKPSKAKAPPRPFASRNKSSPVIGKDTQPNVPAWWVFTRASSAFVESARVLSTLLAKRYGEGVSIAHFERMLAELPSLPAEHRVLISIDDEVIGSYESFLVARKARDAERESFRTSRSIVSVEASLAKAKEIIHGSNDSE
jgi:hypothetical protein